MPVCVALGLVLTSFLLVATAFFAVPSLRSKKIPTTSLIKRPAYLEHSDIPPIDHSDFNYIGKKVSEAADKVLAQFMLEQKNGNSSSGSYVHDVNTDSLLQVTEAMLYELSDMIGPQRDQELMVLATEISELERNLQVVEKDLDTQRLRMVDDTFKVEELHSKLEDEIQVMMNSIHTFAMGLLENTGRRRKHGLERDRGVDTNTDESVDNNLADNYLILTIPNDAIADIEVNMQTAESRLRACSVEELMGKQVTRGVIQSDTARVYMAKFNVPSGMNLLLVGLPEGDDD